MKKILIGICLLGLCGCESDEKYYSNTKNIITIDQCEYLKNPTYFGYVVLTHKGNCKSCRTREVNEKIATISIIVEEVVNKKSENRQNIY